ncbi:hypothetical protein FHG87_008619 [Trinorchestia longiramus]|nr:hypothetical protein FHG87_008619 [Trinorchestia longiramus]
MLECTVLEASLPTRFVMTDRITTRFVMTDSITTRFVMTDRITTRFVMTDRITTRFVMTDCITTRFVMTDCITTRFVMADSINTKASEEAVAAAATTVEDKRDCSEKLLCLQSPPCPHHPSTWLVWHRVAGTQPDTLPPPLPTMPYDGSSMIATPSPPLKKSEQSRRLLRIISSSFG